MIVFVFDAMPTSLSVSKYCVISTRFMTSWAVAPGTPWRNSSTEALSPSTMARR